MKNHHFPIIFPMKPAFSYGFPMVFQFVYQWRRPPSMAQARAWAAAASTSGSTAAAATAGRCSWRAPAACPGPRRPRKCDGARKWRIRDARGVVIDGLVTYIDSIYSWLVDWNMTFIFLYIGDFIIPIDFHIFQRCWNHQPVVNFVGEYSDWKLDGNGWKWWVIIGKSVGNGWI